MVKELVTHGANVNAQSQVRHPLPKTQTRELTRLYSETISVGRRCLRLCIHPEECVHTGSVCVCVFACCVSNSAVQLSPHSIVSMRTHSQWTCHCSNYNDVTVKALAAADERKKMTSVLMTFNL